jgi:thiamine-monophosphate kinase
MPEPRGEFARIAALLSVLPRGEGVVLGPGDDAAVLRLRADADLVVTTDTFVEGVHFRRDLLTSAEAGARLAAANLSDLAAMAAAPRWATLALTVPASWSENEVRMFERACARTLAADGAAIVGGNLTAGDGALTATLTLFGEAGRDDAGGSTAWTRSGARAGDIVAVTGAPGSAAAFLALALWAEPPSRERAPSEIAERFILPASRVPLARRLLATGGVHAAVDISDGLAADLAHVCTASGVGAELDEARLPADEPLRAAARTLSAFAGQERGPLPAAAGGLLRHLMLSASDDYELLLAIAPEAWEPCAAEAAAAGVPLAAIGRITAEPGLRLRTSDGPVVPLEPLGWDHFAG